MRYTTITCFITFLMVFNYAFAKAESHSPIYITTAIQSPTDLIPKIEELPRQISDTLNRDYDQRRVEVPPIQEDLREEYTGEDFNYIETESQKGSNAFSRAIGAFFDWLGKLFGFDISPFWIEFFKYLFYGILGTVVLYFIVRLLMDDSPAALLGRKGKKVGDVIIEETHIDNIDLEKLINENIQSGKYREAIRYLYLNALKKLSSKSLIDWDFQKTNTDYYRELKDPKIKAQFKKVSYLYDYIWYGEFPIDSEKFTEAREEFMILEKQAA